MWERGTAAPPTRNPLSLSRCAVGDRCCTGCGAYSEIPHSLPASLPHQAHLLGVRRPAGHDLLPNHSHGAHHARAAAAAVHRAASLPLGHFSTTDIHSWDAAAAGGAFGAAQGIHGAVYGLHGQHPATAAYGHSPAGSAAAHHAPTAASNAHAAAHGLHPAESAAIHAHAVAHGIHPAESAAIHAAAYGLPHPHDSGSLGAHVAANGHAGVYRPYMDVYGSHTLDPAPYAGNVGHTPFARSDGYTRDMPSLHARGGAHGTPLPHTAPAHLMGRSVSSPYDVWPEPRNLGIYMEEAAAGQPHQPEVWGGGHSGWGYSGGGEPGGHTRLRAHARGLAAMDRVADNDARSRGERLRPPTRALSGGNIGQRWGPPPQRPYLPMSPRSYERTHGYYK